MIENEAKILISQAVKQNISDIHIMPSEHNYSVHFRSNGYLIEWGVKDLSWGKRLISYFKFLADMDVGEKRRPQSGACEFNYSSKAGEEKLQVELRFSTITNVNLLESLVIRVIFSQHNQSTLINTYFPQDLTIMRQLIQRKSGLVLFSGPVGSGKTTTIYQLLRERAVEEAIQVITMEDPVEIHEPAFLQTQVNEKANINYDLLIKSALRHHPDILFIGEIRDEETARMTIRGALTGHLMIATIHARDTAGVIARLQELNISYEQLKQTLIGVISQRLVPCYCNICHTSGSIECSHIPKHFKRAAIFELLESDNLKLLFQHDSFNQFQIELAGYSLNHKLRKAWAYGFIDSKNYRYFEII